MIASSLSPMLVPHQLVGVGSHIGSDSLKGCIAVVSNKVLMLSFGAYFLNRFDPGCLVFYADLDIGKYEI